MLLSYKVVLFGSRARGDYYRASDIDLAAHGGNINRYGEAYENYFSYFRVYYNYNSQTKKEPPLRIVTVR